jgi:hypothetical protein
MPKLWGPGHPAQDLLGGAGEGAVDPGSDAGVGSGFGSAGIEQTGRDAMATIGASAIRPKRLADRLALQGILFVLHTGIAWRPLP